MVPLDPAKFSHLLRVGRGASDLVLLELQDVLDNFLGTLSAVDRALVACEFISAW